MVGTAQAPHSWVECREEGLAQLDAICLDFCIALLDHPLLGSLHDSLVVGFLAILGVVRDTSTFQTPLNYTPQLLGFIKIRQMLVLQKAVHYPRNRHGPVNILLLVPGRNLK